MITDEMDVQPDKAFYSKVPGLEGVSLFKAHFTRFSFIRHTHDDFAIGAVTKGLKAVRHKGTGYELPEGSVITVNPDDPHDGRPFSAEGCDYFIIYIKQGVLEETIREEFGNLACGPYFSTPFHRDRKMSEMLLGTFRTLQNPDTDRVTKEGALRRIVFSLFEKTGGLGNQAGHSGAETKKVPSGLLRARDFVRSCEETDFPIERLAEIACMSNFHFIREFSRYFGMTPHSYLVQTKIRRAQKALENGRPIAKTAFDLNFTDQSHMTRWFRNLLGVTPGEYRDGFR